MTDCEKERIGRQAHRSKMYFFMDIYLILTNRKFSKGVCNYLFDR
jgi:hypothetical protein